MFLVAILFGYQKYLCVTQGYCNAWSDLWKLKSLNLWITLQEKFFNYCVMYSQELIFVALGQAKLNTYGVYIGEMVNKLILQCSSLVYWIWSSWVFLVISCALALCLVLKLRKKKNEIKYTLCGTKKKKKKLLIPEVEINYSCTFYFIYFLVKIFT